MKFSLLKLSDPGWIKEYDNTLELKAELYTHICKDCCDVDGISETSAIGNMLATSCGCEYDWEQNGN